MTEIIKRIILLIVLSVISVLVIKALFTDADITTQSGRYAWSAVVVSAAGIIYFAADSIWTEIDKDQTKG